MAKKTKNQNPIVLRRGAGIGSGNAETDDDFLFDCFVEYPPVEECRRLGSPTMVISGRTGSGKTAILRYLENTSEHSVALDPFEMAMSYVANSDALRFLEAIGADLDLLFQVLWKHVLCIEFIRLRWSVDNTDRSSSIFMRLSEKFSRDERKTKSIRYLREWQGKFWITMDQNIKEITESVERKLHSEIGGEIVKFKAGGQYDKRLSQEKKSEIVARTRKIISSEQLSELHGVIDMLSVSDGDTMKAFFIMVDRLDERWVDDTVRFRLIKALVESLRSFRKIRNLKILVALRSDVIERVVQETQDISFQREKFEDVMTRLVWSKAELRELVDMRLSALFKRQYTGKTIGFADIFPESVGGKVTFDWLLERTLMRPRDVIAFVNESIDAAAGHPSISVAALRRAEVEFARKRKDALLQEWKSAFGTLNVMLNLVTSRRKAGVEVIELIDKVDDFCLEVCSGRREGKDPMHELCTNYVEGKKRDPIDIIQEVMAILYRTGAVGIKLNPQDRYNYAHLDQPIIAPAVISLKAKVRLHPMLHAAFNLQERERT
jgi:hypothetical protein